MDKITQGNVNRLLKHSDVTTHIKNAADQDILTRPNFDVNMRLFRTSPGYRRVVKACAAYVRQCAMTEREGYKKPHGYSGANGGIPFRIIALANGTVMLNPRIVAAGGNRQSLSNCGSLTLDKPIEVWRYEWVRVKYFDLHGNKQTFEGYGPTIQHEVDHCNGILITQRQNQRAGFLEVDDAYDPNQADR